MMKNLQVMTLTQISIFDLRHCVCVCAYVCGGIALTWSWGQEIVKDAVNPIIYCLHVLLWNRVNVKNAN